MAGQRDSVLGNIDINEFDPIHFSVDEIAGLIIEFGTECEVRRAWVCPCVRIETGMPSGACNACRGLGYIYPDKGRYKTTLLLSDRSNEVQQTAAGEIPAPRSMRVTMLPGMEMARGDLVFPKCDTHTVQEHFVRASQQVDPYTLPRAYDVMPTALSTRSERLLYANPVELSLYYLDTQERPVEARQGPDFQLVPSGEGVQVQWTAGRGPSPGSGYSVRYRAPAAYQVFTDKGSTRSSGGAILPQKIEVMRLDRIAELDRA